MHVQEAICAFTGRNIDCATRSTNVFVDSSNIKNYGESKRLAAEIAGKIMLLYDVERKDSAIPSTVF